VSSTKQGTKERIHEPECRTAETDNLVMKKDGDTEKLKNEQTLRGPGDHDKRRNAHATRVLRKRRNRA
jgi:hypothetical protein